MYFKMIVGLGNPTSQYHRTRHNVGFMVVDRMLSKLDLEANEKMFNGVFAKFIHDDVCWFIAKPQTYMNLSGDFVSKMAEYYKILLDDIVVVCDDLSMELGKTRIKTDSGHGGHNGLKDIILKMKTNRITRIKIGIGKPENKTQINEFVTSKFSEYELIKIDEAVEQVSDMIIGMINEI
ncbi:MAG: aminoacyl-tRNA hydrolase [Mycoplasmataceae bacterium]|jgi:PTH1 family peptidyl-tRNA hydrolase|nr:aminoacyl-tRNA hydrolase [Mycoplasmataceae bacterium]